MDGLFDLARQMADDVWPGRQLSEEAHMRDDEHPQDYHMPLVVWETNHRPHGVLTSVRIPGATVHQCPCGWSIVSYDAPKRAQ